MRAESLQFLDTPDGETLACHHQPGSLPGVLFLPGFQSNMQGTKAVALADWCRREGRACTRFDYTGHGASSGSFEEGSIGAWLMDARSVLDRVTEGPQLLVGSSMGGWVALLLALERPERVAGILTIACAADFTERYLLPSLTGEQLDHLERTGRVELPSNYTAEGYVITSRLIEEARRHLVLDGPIPLTCPVRLLHGLDDPDVPWETSHQVLERLTAEDVRLILLKNGDHRLSAPAHLAAMTQLVGELAALAGD